jgi:hypothetical protein
MTSNPHNYGKAPVEEPEEMSVEDHLVEQMGQVKVLRRYRYIYNRLAVIAKEGNLMINHPEQGFVLIDDLEKYMTEPL